MLISLLLSLTLAAGAPAGQAADARAQAEQLAKSGSYRAALERFQAIAAANPDDVEARLWIARLHDLMGNERHAVDVYESIIATHPQNLNALIGAGQALVELRRYREAADALNRAESLAAENPTVLAAQGKLHAAAGRTTLALAYYARALTIDPGLAGAQAEYEAVKRQHAHRLELGYFFEHFNTDIPDPQAGTAALNARVSENLRVVPTVQVERKFSRTETRAGGGVEWTARHGLEIHAGALFGGDAQVLPRSDGYGGVNVTRGRATWSFDLRFAEFENVDVQIGGAGLRMALPGESHAWVKYYRFATDYERGLSDIVQSWVLGASGRPSPNWLLGAEYTRGPDQLEMLTIDRLGPFETNTYSAFAEVLLTPMFSAHARYDYQNRPEDVTVHRATLRLVHRF